MRFCVTSNDPYYPLRGGGCLRINKIVQKLARNHIVYVVAPSRSAPSKRNVIVYPFNSTSISRFDKHKIFKYAIFSLLLIPKLFWLCIRKKIDLIIAHNTVGGFSAVVVGKLLRKRTILDTTDLLALYVKTYSNKHVLLQVVAIAFELVTFKLADKIITVSNAMKDELRRCGIDLGKMTVVYDGAEAGKLMTKKSFELPVIIHLGGVDPYNNVQVIARAAPYVIKKNPDAIFLIVGTGVSLAEVKKIVRKNGVEKNFVFTGWVEYKEVQHYLEQASIGVIGRSNILANHLVLTLKLPEYWASGVAIVAPKLKAISEVAEGEKDVLFYKPDNEIDLGDKINMLLENDCLRKKLAANGRLKLEENFDWEKLSSQISNICESLACACTL